MTRRLPTTTVPIALLASLLLVAPAVHAQSFDYEISDDTVTITGYYGVEGDVVIPSTIDDLPVTRIGDEAFDYCGRLTNVFIPDTVISIGAKAFYSCTRLASVVIGNSVTSIGKSAFYYCGNLTNVSFPDSLVTIGDNAFGSCGKLGSIAIPDSVASIGAGAFRGCSSLTGVSIGNSVTSIGNRAFLYCDLLSAITVDPLNAAYSSVDGVLFDKSQTALIQYPMGRVATDYTIPGSVTSIGDSAFFGCDLTGVAIPDSVTSIGNSAFEECTSLTGVNLPDSVASIGAYAFCDCDSLTGISIPNSVASIEEGTFYGCNRLNSIAIPDSVTSVGSSAFESCSSLSSIVIPDTVTSIGDSAFLDCGTLTGVIIGNGVASIGSGAFHGCGRLSSITVGPLNSAYSSLAGVFFDKNQTALLQYPMARAATAYTIPASVTSIEDYAFYNCDSLTAIALPDGLLSIGDSAFEGCARLTGVALPDSVTSIGWYAFGSCGSLTSVTIPDSVAYIGWTAFENCVSLGVIAVGPANGFYCSVDGVLFDWNQTMLIQCPMAKTGTSHVSSTVTNIPDGAFSGCRNLSAIIVDPGNGFYSSVDEVLFDRNQTTLIQCPMAKTGTSHIPSTVTDILDGAFSGCDSLGAIVVDPANEFYTSVDGVLFNYDQTLLIRWPGTKVGVCHVPGTLTEIVYDALAGCNSLRAIEVDSSNKYYSSLDGVLFDKGQTALLQYPGGKGSSYTVPAQVTDLGSSAFSGCTGLTAVYFQGNAIYRSSSSPPCSSGDDTVWAPFEGATNVTVFYLPGTTGWGTTYLGHPAVLWDPQIETSDGSFGVKAGKFGFTIAASSDVTVVVEACENVGSPAWLAVATNTLASGAFYFSDPQWTASPHRFYRLRLP